MKGLVSSRPKKPNLQLMKKQTNKQTNKTKQNKSKTPWDATVASVVKQVFQWKSLICQIFQSTDVLELVYEQWQCDY